MVRAAAAIGAVLLIGVIASGVNGQEQNAPGRYQLTPDGDGFLRLDTVSGAVSYCSLVDGRWQCTTADAGASAAAIAALSERLAALEAEIAALTAGLGEASIAAPASQTDAIEARLAAIEQSLADLAGDTRLETVTAAIAELAAGLANFGDGQQSLAERVERIGASLPGIVDEIEALAADIDGVGGMLAELTDLEQRVVDAGDAASETAAAALDRVLSAVAETEASLQATLADLAAANADFVERIAALETAVDAGDDSLAAAVAALQQRQDAVEASLAALAETAAIPAVDPQIADRLAAIEAMLADGPTPLMAELAAITARQDAIEIALSELAATPLDPDLAAGIAELRQETEALAAALSGSEIDPALLALPDLVAGLAERVEGVAARLDEPAPDLSPAINALSERIAAIEAVLAGLADRDDLSPALAAVQSELEAIAGQQAALSELLAVPVPDTANAEIRTMLADLRASVEKLAGDLAAIASADAAAADTTESGLQAIEERIAAVEAIIAAGGSEGNDDGRLDAIEAALAELETAVSGIAPPDLTALAERIDSLAARQEEILAAIEALAAAPDPAPAGIEPPTLGEPTQEPPASQDETAVEERRPFAEELVIRLNEFVGGLRHGRSSR